MVRHGLAECIRKSGERYLPEDVWPLLRQQKAYLYLIGSPVVGFCILEQQLDPDGLCLFVFALWCEKGAGKATQAEIWRELDELKDRMGAKRMRWHGRKGWGRFAKVKSYIYER